MAWWFPEQHTPEYNEMIEQALLGLESGSTFGRFAGRRNTTYSWNEWLIKLWLDRHGIPYFHNYKIREGGAEYQCDFFLNSLGACVECNPSFHRTYQPVIETDRRKKLYMKMHGIRYIEIVVYDNIQKYYDEIERKLRPLVR